MAADIAFAQSKEQKRARAAWDYVQGLTRADREDYSQRVNGFAPDILTNGILQTLATYKRSGTVGELKLVDHIEKWLFSSSEDAGIDWGTFRAGTIIETLAKCDSDVYRRAQIEALAFIVWLKRFAKEK